jgi:hypothetical protein
MAAKIETLLDWRWNQAGNCGGMMEHNGVCAVMADVVGCYGQ